MDDLRCETIDNRQETRDKRQETRNERQETRDKKVTREKEDYPLSFRRRNDLEIYFFKSPPLRLAVTSICHYYNQVAPPGLECLVLKAIPRVYISSLSWRRGPGRGGFSQIIFKCLIRPI